MSLDNFESLSNLPGHISSFTASSINGNIINDTANSQEEAKSAVQLIHDATELSHNIPALKSEKLKSVTVTCQDKYHSYTVSNGVIYGVQRENDP